MPRKVSIEYCTMWNYRPRAASLAAEIRDTLGVTPELIASGGGVFEVRVDDRLVFSKKQLGRFPEPGEVLRLLG